MAKVLVNAAHAAAEGGQPMSDINRTIRDKEADARKAWRKADGDESLGDKAANVGDRVTNAVKDAGDEVHEQADRMSRDAAYEEGRSDELSRSR